MSSANHVSITAIIEAIYIEILVRILVHLRSVDSALKSNKVLACCEN